MVKPIKVKSSKSESEAEVQMGDATQVPSSQASGSLQPLGSEEAGGLVAEVLHDPTVVETLTEDPLFKFIKRNGNTLSTLLMLGVIAWVGYRAYQSSYVAAMENSAEVYAGVRSGLEGLKGNNSALAEKLEKREELAKKLETAKAEGKDTKDDEKALTDLVAEVTSLEKGRDDQVASLSEKLEVLQEQRAPYGLLVDGYRDLLNVRLGRKDGLGDALATVKWREAKPESRERLLSELRALLLARALVDVDGQKNTALETLKNLALDGEFVHAAAGQAWATVYQDGKSGDSAVAAEIKALLEQIVEKHPEQAENFPSLQ